MSGREIATRGLRRPTSSYLIANTKLNNGWSIDNVGTPTQTGKTGNTRMYKQDREAKASFIHRPGSNALLERRQTSNFLQYVTSGQAAEQTKRPRRPQHAKEIERCLQGAIELIISGKTEESAEFFLFALNFCQRTRTPQILQYQSVSCHHWANETRHGRI